MPVDAITRRLQAIEALKKAHAALAAKRAARAQAAVVVPGILTPPDPQPKPQPKPRRKPKAKRRRESGKAVVRPSSAAVVSSKPVDGSITFRCTRVPALGVVLPVAGMISFQNGTLTLDNADDIAMLRKNSWYGTWITEVAPVEKGGAGDGVDPGTGDGPASSAGTEGPPPVPPAASRPDGGTMLMYKKFLVQAEGGGFRCSLCEPISPFFPTELAAIQHVFRGHSPQEVNRG